MASQRGIFCAGDPWFDPHFQGIERIALDRGAWVEHLPQWLEGAEAVFSACVRAMRWRADSRRMYDRVVEVPRLTACVPKDGEGHPVLVQLADCLGRRFGEPLGSIGLAYYRNGRDSVAMHGDRLGKRVHNSVVAIVSIGEPRRFLLKPRDGGRSMSYSLGWGDLLVMGGSCQRDWVHGVPKVAAAGPRISIQFRPGVVQPERSANPSRHPT
ncbi:MAG: alpha-ketoglutarate-dependent dioxygenase AlkB [Gammaproteobacteria bacterium]